MLTNDRLFANGASIVKTGQFTKAMGVNGVSARQILGRLATAKHVFAANGAVVFVLVLEALVRLKDRDGNAHAAFIAVAKGFNSTHTAKTTLYAMKRFLGLFRVEF